jgi:DNA-binding transcriptional ArsR family regulator
MLEIGGGRVRARQRGATTGDRRGAAGTGGADAAFTVRQVARVAGVSHNRAHQVILRLAEHGLVLTEEQGPSKLCRLNREHLAATAVVELVQLRARMLEFLRQEIAGWAVAPSTRRCSDRRPEATVTRPATWTFSSFGRLAAARTTRPGASNWSPVGSASTRPTGTTSPGSTSPAPTCGARYEPASRSSMSGGAMRSDSWAATCAACYGELREPAAALWPNGYLLLSRSEKWRYWSPSAQHCAR